MRKGWKIFWIVVGALVAVAAIAVLGFVVWASNPLPAMPEALVALQSDDEVSVAYDQWYSFSPQGETAKAGFIFYPGARVDPRAYAPAAHALAAQGYYVAITPMPLNFAIFAPDKAMDVMNAHPEVENWVIGGHSLGGAMAGQFAAQKPTLVDGLVFWAAFPPENASLAGQTEMAVASIYGTLDGLATPAKVLAATPLLPPSAQFVPIEGGNHAQFGWYGDQPGDNPATISRIDQQEQTVAATAAVLAAAAK